MLVTHIHDIYRLISYPFKQKIQDTQFNNGIFKSHILVLRMRDIHTHDIDRLISYPFKQKIQDTV